MEPAKCVSDPQPIDAEDLIGPANRGVVIWVPFFTGKATKKGNTIMVEAAMPTIEVDEDGEPMYEIRELSFEVGGRLFVSYLEDKN